MEDCIINFKLKQHDQSGKLNVVMVYLESFFLFWPIEIVMFHPKCEHYSTMLFTWVFSKNSILVYIAFKKKKTHYSINVLELIIVHICYTNFQNCKQ